MSKYYYLIAGLPNIALDDGKLTYSVQEFRTEIEDILSHKDKKLIDLFYLKYDNINLLAHVNHSEKMPDSRGKISFDEFDALNKALKDEEKIPKNDKIPSYIVDFLKSYIAEESKENNNEKEYLSWEDRLATLYYEYAMKCGNKFVANWFELNLNINNILTAITCRKHGFNKANYIVGHNKIAENIRTSNARDFGLGDSVDYLPELQHVAEETDLLAREKKIDLLKWKWLDDNTFFKTFDIESVFAYLVKLEMIERWLTLDKAKGEKTFRELVGAMKTGSENALEEFKRNNIK